jgi:3-deoxy-D-manno-octulosonic-acid transferase
VSSLGDHAYVLHLAPRNEREYPTALVVVTSGTNTAAISVRAKEGQTAESAQPEAVELAKLVVSKLN